MKKFEEPIIEILKLDMIDVIASSFGGPNDENAGEEDEF